MTIELKAGPSADNEIDTTGATDPVVCDLTLMVTDASGVSAEQTTTVTI